MLRQIILVVFTFLAAYLHGGTATRLYLLAILLVKPLLALIVGALLLFIVSRSSDICGSLLSCVYFWIAWNIVSVPPFRFPWHLQAAVDKLPVPPPLDPLFQRPPPSRSR